MQRRNRLTRKLRDKYYTIGDEELLKLSLLKFLSDPLAEKSFSGGDSECLEEKETTINL